MWKVKKSKVHGTGIFATQVIPKNTKVIEYIGEKVNRSEGDKRSEKRIKKFLNSKKTGSVYIFELNSKYDIDGSPLYNKARYINHSCDPNCEVDIIRGHIWISSIKKIKENGINFFIVSRLNSLMMMFYMLWCFHLQKFLAKTYLDRLLF